MYACLRLSGVLGNLFQTCFFPYMPFVFMEPVWDPCGGWAGIHFGFMETPVAWTVNCLISPLLLICAAFSAEYFFSLAFLYMSFLFAILKFHFLTVAVVHGGIFCFEN